MTDFEKWQNLTRDALSALYERKNMPEIAAQFGVTTGAVAHKLKAWGLTARTTGKKHSPGPKRGFNPPIDELESLYRQMSMREIAKHYGVGETVVFHRVKEAGFAPISRSERLSGKPKSERHRLAMSIATKGKMAGPSNPNWRGGVTSERMAGRSKPEYRAWKEAVLSAAGYQCQRCEVAAGSRCGCCGHIVRLHVHHKVSYALVPERRYDPANGEALCEKCHHVEHYAQKG